MPRLQPDPWAEATWREEALLRQRHMDEEAEANGSYRWQEEGMMEQLDSMDGALGQKESPEG